MGKRMSPKWATKKSQCGCGAFYYRKLITGSLKLSTGCSVCSPEQYKEEEKK